MFSGANMVLAKKRYIRTDISVNIQPGQHVHGSCQETLNTHRNFS